jgi:hypothetical protein
MVERKNDQISMLQDANERADGGIHEVRKIPPLAAIRDNAWVGKSHDKHPSLSPTSVETN